MKKPKIISTKNRKIKFYDGNSANNIHFIDSLGLNNISTLPPDIVRNNKSEKNDLWFDILYHPESVSLNESASKKRFFVDTSSSFIGELPSMFFIKEVVYL